MQPVPILSFRISPYVRTLERVSRIREPQPREPQNWILRGDCITQRDEETPSPGRLDKSRPVARRFRRIRKLQNIPAKTTRFESARFNEMKMLILNVSYKFLSRFAFLAFTYSALNSIGKYEERAVVALLALLYSSTRLAAAIRTLGSFRTIERFEIEAKAAASFDPAKVLALKSIIRDVADIRREGELRGWIEFLFQAIVIAVCISKLLID